jgi:hypothetical protein
MRHLNRFWNSLSRVFYAFLRLLRQIVPSAPYVVEDHPAESEQEHQNAPDARFTDTNSVAPHVESKENPLIPVSDEGSEKPIQQQPAVVQSGPAQNTSAPVRPQAELKGKATPAASPVEAKSQTVREVAPIPDKPGAHLPTLSQPNPAEKVSTPLKPQPPVETKIERPSRSVVEPKKVGTPAGEVPAVPGKVVAGRQSAVPQPSTVNAPVPITPESGNGGLSEKRSGNGKYSPGAITDQTAQRLARLLISEIKLYYKTDSEGSSNNVYDLLKDPIEKARKYYGQRLGTTAVDSMPDYFHAELVRALCAGDPSRLGPNYHHGSDK